MKRPFCLLLTGEPNSGKSTLAYALVQKRLRNTLIIDGDKHREAQFLGEKLGFTREDILKNNDHVIKLAKFAQDQGFNVLIPQIAPYVEQRLRMRAKLKNFYEVFLDCSRDVRGERANFTDTSLIYEKGYYDILISTDSELIDECVDQILEYLNDN